MPHDYAPTIPATAARTFAVADAVPRLPPAAFAQAVGPGFDPALRAVIVASPRLRRRIGERLFRKKGESLEVVLPDTATASLLARSDDAMLRRARRCAAACLNAAAIRRTIARDDVAALRATYGDEAYEMALGPLGDGAPGPTDGEADADVAGWRAMGAALAACDAAPQALLLLRFDEEERALMRSEDPRAAATFEAVADRLVHGDRSIGEAAA